MLAVRTSGPTAGSARCSATTTGTGCRSAPGPCRRCWVAERLARPALEPGREAVGLGHERRRPRRLARWQLVVVVELLEVPEHQPAALEVECDHLPVLPLHRQQVAGPRLPLRADRLPGQLTVLGDQLAEAVETVAGAEPAVRDFEVELPQRCGERETQL